MNADSDLPSWTSQAVAALGPAQAELLGRLTSEPRMKRVWREFGRRRRSDGAPLYPVEAPILLLMEVLKLTKERTYVIPRRDATMARDHYLAVAEVLKRDAQRFTDFPQTHSRSEAEQIAWSAKVNCLAEAARFYDDLAACCAGRALSDHSARRRVSRISTKQSRRLKPSAWCELHAHWHSGFRSDRWEARHDLGAHRP